MGTDPRTLAGEMDVSGDRTLGNENELLNNSSVTTARNETLSVGDSRLFVSTLDGIGERCGVPNLVVQWEDEQCPDQSFVRYPGESGCDYSFDVDVVTITTPQAGQLCVSGWLGASPPSHRIDVIAMPLPETCGLPEGFVVDEADDEVLGFGVYADRIEYSFPVEAGTRHAIMVAGWAAHDPDAIVPYNLAVTLVPEAPDGGGAVLCPLLPDFVSPEGGGQ